MTKLQKANVILHFGGLKALALKVSDKLTGRDQFTRYYYHKLENVDPKEYPRLLKDWNKLHGQGDLDIDNPNSFNEKIQWIKLHDITPLMTKLADKYLVREWIIEKIGEQYLVPLLGVWDRFDEINFEELPDRFVLKCNHGSGMNLVVKDKKTFDRAEAKTKFDCWMATNFAFMKGFELQYKDIPRKIIAEEYIEQMDKDMLDFKIHCFRGEPKIIQVIGSRDQARHTAKEGFFDLSWNPVDLMYHTYDSYETLPEKPDNLDEMLRIARELSEEFRYVRVDIYDISGKILFGEMTFTPASGYGKWGHLRRWAGCAIRRSNPPSPICHRRGWRRAVAIPPGCGRAHTDAGRMRHPLW